MSSPPRVILLDSNAYFRLARSIRPLLSQSFGDPPPYVMKVIGDLDREFKRNHRLSSKFHWVSEKKYSVDRENSQYLARGKTATQVDNALSYLSYQAKVESIDISYVDLKVLAVGYARNFPVITDDKGMQKLAETFCIKCCSTLKLLKLMLDCERIDTGKIHETVEYWNAENDLPNSLHDFKQIYKEIFNEASPI